MLDTVLFFFCLILFLLLLRPTLIAIEIGFWIFLMRLFKVGRETVIGLLALICELVLLYGAFRFYPF